MKKIFILVLPLFFLSGCTIALLGAGAAGGYALGKDCIQGDTDRSFEDLYAIALETVNAMGVVESKFSNPSIAKINARVNTSSLQITIERLTQQTVRLKVRSRKNLMPNIELAQKVYNNILLSSP